MSVKSLRGRHTAYATRIKLLRVKYKIRLQKQVSLETLIQRCLLRFFMVSFTLYHVISYICVING